MGGHHSLRTSLRHQPARGGDAAVRGFRGSALPGSSRPRSSGSRSAERSSAPPRADHGVEAFRGCRACGYTVIACSSSSARCCAGFGVVVIWKVEPRLLPTRASQVLRTMVESSARSVRKLWTGEPSLSVRVATFSSAASERSAGGDRIAMFFALQILVGKQQLAPGLAHVPLDIVGEHAQEDVRAHAAFEIDGGWGGYADRWFSSNGTPARLRRGLCNCAPPRRSSSVSSATLVRIT